MGNNEERKKLMPADIISIANLVCTIISIVTSTISIIVSIAGMRKRDGNN